MIYNKDNSINSVYFSDCNKTFNGINFSPDEWEVNTDNGWEVEFAENKVTIKKFKIDTWGLRRKVTTDTYKNYNKLKVKVTGMDLLSVQIGGFNTSNYVPSGGYYGHSVDTAYAPGKWTSGNEAYGLIMQFGGGYENTIISSGLNTVDYPSEQFLKHPWDGTWYHTYGSEQIDGIYTGPSCDGSYTTYLIGIYGGSGDSTSDKYYKIWTPIQPLILELVPTEIDPQSQECWKIYNKDVVIYNKDKTIENCWRKYKYTTDKTGSDTYYSFDCSNWSDYKLKVPPMITDLDNIQATNWVTFNCKNVLDDSFWTTIKEWFANHDLTNPKVFNNRHTKATPSLFGESDISGELTLNINNDNILQLPDFIYGTKISSINLNFKAGIISSALNIFRRASSLTNITTNKPFLAKELAGAFEFCSSLTSIPSIIDYSQRNKYNLTNAPYAFEYSTKLTEVSVGYGGSIDAGINTPEEEKNILKASNIRQMCNCCTSLEKFYPILDVEAIDQSTDAAKDAFTSCGKLTYLRIKNLNKGDWYFDGTVAGWNLSNLSSDCIDYLLQYTKNIKVQSTTNGTETYKNSFNVSAWSCFDDLNKDWSYDRLYISEANKIVADLTLPEATSGTVMQVKISLEEYNTFSPVIYFYPDSASSTFEQQKNFLWKATTSEQNNWMVYTISANSLYAKKGTVWHLYIEAEEVSSDNSFTLFIQNPYNANGCDVTSANIYIPAKWVESSLNTTYITNANNKGWTLHYKSGNTDQIITEDSLAQLRGTN